MDADAFCSQNKFMKALVSIIIPTYNSAPYIQEAVTSVLQQTYQSIEIIIVDDGSTDGTKQVLADYIKNGGITYIPKENGGPASARNVGIRSARGEFISFLDADDIWGADKLKRQIPLFQDLNVGLVYSDMTFLGAKTKNATHSEGTKGFFRGNVLRQLIMNNFIPTSSVVVRRSVFEKIGLFDEDRRLIAVEDYDLWLKIAHEFNIDFVDEPLVNYRLHENQISKNANATYRKLFYLYKKHAASDPHIPHKLLFYLRYFFDRIRYYKSFTF